MSKFFSIRQVADFLRVSHQTLRRWEASKKLFPSHRTPGGQRRYTMVQLQPHCTHIKTSIRPTIAYARVSSHDQKDDLERQVRMKGGAILLSRTWVLE